MRLNTNSDSLSLKGGPRCLYIFRVVLRNNDNSSESGLKSSDGLLIGGIIDYQLTTVKEC